MQPGVLRVVPVGGLGQSRGAGERQRVAGRAELTTRCGARSPPQRRR